MKQLVLRLKNLSDFAIKEFVGLKPKINSFLVDDSSEHKEGVLLNKNCLRHSMNIIQSKDHRIGTYKINKISLSWFDDKIYMQNNGYDGLAIHDNYYNLINIQ